MKKIIISIAAVLAILIGAAAAYIAWDNKRVVNASYTFESEKVPPQFDGFKIALITDFHNSDNYAEVAETVRIAEPDIICIVGDLVSMKTTNYSNTKELVSRLMKISQVYYAYGNHEYYNATYRGFSEPPIKEVLATDGVLFMNNEVRTVKRNGAIINLIGYGDSIHDDTDGAFWQHAEPFMAEVGESIDKSVLSIMLLHRAQYFDEVSEYPFDLVLGGHMHGGEINIEPFKSQILKKRVGTDKYSKGEYFKNGHELIISSGCANGDGVRILNTPEVVSVTLKRVEK